MAHKNTLSVSTDVAKRLDITCRKGDTFELTINAADSTGLPIDFNVFIDMIYLRYKLTFWSKHITKSHVLPFTFLIFSPSISMYLQLRREEKSMLSSLKLFWFPKLFISLKKSFKSSERM